MILRRDAKVKLISRVPLFEGCSGRELAQVASIAEQVELPQGAVLIREGEPGRDFFAVVEGSVDVRQNGRRIATLGPGDFVGEIALLHEAREEPVLDRHVLDLPGFEATRPVGPVPGEPDRAPVRRHTKKAARTVAKARSGSASASGKKETLTARTP